MTKKIISNAIAACLAISINGSSLASAPTHEIPAINGQEKCYGIAKAGRNDCGSAAHSCAGEAKIDSDKSAWLLVPTGLCDKIIGGSLKAPEKV